MVDLSELRPDLRLLERCWNTYVRIPLPWRGDPFQYRHWKQRGIGDSHGPTHYVELQDAGLILVDEVTRRLGADDAPVLDLGCNVGRHLNALFERGYRKLHGVDVQTAALRHTNTVFPELAAVAELHEGTFQDYLPTVPDRFFKVAFTLGATLELVSPWFPLCAQIARITNGAVVLAISETGHAYPRLWEREFLRAGFLMTSLRRPICARSGLSLMVFERLGKG